MGDTARPQTAMRQPPKLRRLFWLVCSSATGGGQGPQLKIWPAISAGRAG